VNFVFLSALFPQAKPNMKDDSVFFEKKRRFCLFLALSLSLLRQIYGYNFPQCSEGFQGVF
jgi:hypothetical protein